MYEGLRKPEDLITLVIALLANGCPVQAIVRTFGLDERTVARWLDRAGAHCQQVHQALIVQAGLDLQHVQVDEIYAKGYKLVAWVAMAIMVPTRLWLGGVVSASRDQRLTDALLRLVRACCLPLMALLICCDGFAAYPGSIARAFCDKVPNPFGTGRHRLQAWPEILVGIVNKHRQQKRLMQVTREMLQGGIAAPSTSCRRPALARRSIPPLSSVLTAPCVSASPPSRGGVVMPLIARSGFRQACGW